MAGVTNSVSPMSMRVRSSNARPARSYEQLAVAPAFIFHWTSKGQFGRPFKSFDKLWRKALAAAKLPPDRIFHDLRRSAVRNLIRAGVDPSVAMKISGHQTRSMLDRYHIVGEAEAAGFTLAHRYLSSQPKVRNVEEGQTIRGHSCCRRSGSPCRSAHDGGSEWESNPPLRGSARSRTALKAAQVTRPDSLPRCSDDDSRGISSPAPREQRHRYHAAQHTVWIYSDNLPPQTPGRI